MSDFLLGGVVALAVGGVITLFGIFIMEALAIRRRKRK